MPGVPDVYQGCEIVMLSLVDPDNRRPVDWTDRGERLARVVADEPAFDLDDEKLRVTARALRTRREDADGPRVVTVATRAAGLLAAAGGFGEAVVEVPGGTWHDVLSDREEVVEGGEVRLAELLADRPVALLVRQL